MPQEYYSDDAAEGGYFVVIAPRGHWVRQARTATEAWQASGVKTLNEFADANYQQFCLLIGALHALGKPISAELMARAQMGPIGF
jgi:hypothetical protein